METSLEQGQPRLLVKIVLGETSQYRSNDITELKLLIIVEDGKFSAELDEEIVEIFRSRVVGPTFVACINFMITLKTVLSSSIL